MENAIFEAIERVARDDLADGESALWEHAGAVLRARLAARRLAFEQFISRIDHPDPCCAAIFALGAGALVESGIEAEPLALAVIAPFSRALSAAHRFAARAAELSEDEEGAYIGGRTVDAESLEVFAAADPEGSRAHASLGIWYRPIAAAWTRCLPVLRAVRADAGFRTLVAPLAAELRSIDALLKVLLDAPFVALFPEIDEAYAFRVDGCVDVGQLSVLIAAALPEPLRRIGAGEPPSPEVVSIMRGEGPHQSGDYFNLAFHLYAWQAMRAETLLPENGRYTWTAPGGSGDISLVLDFLPGDITPSADGIRVIAVVGLDAPGASTYTRGLTAGRYFNGLPAELTDVRRLGPDEHAALKRTLRAALADS